MSMTGARKLAEQKLATAKALDEIVAILERLEADYGPEGVDEVCEVLDMATPDGRMLNWRYPRTMAEEIGEMT